MSSLHNYITVPNPNGPDPASLATVPFAQLVDAPADENSIFDPGIANVQVKDLYLTNYAVRISKGEFAHDALFLNTSAQGIELLGSCLFPQGSFESRLHNGKQVVQSYSGTQNFKFDPLNEFRHRIPAHTPFHLIHFSVDPLYFLDLLPLHEKWADQLKKKIIQQERVIGYHSPAITLAQERALDVITDCPLDGKLGEMMIETSITQIMLIQLSAIFQSQQGFKTISKRDAEIVHGIKEYLTKTFLDDHTLEGLARNFGTNTTKLMMLFKKNFGKSIFEFLSELKMEHAHKLLQDDFQVSQVSRIVGYKNAHHFSTAFKKHFGMCPSDLIKLKMVG